MIVPGDLRASTVPWFCHQVLFLSNVTHYAEEGNPLKKRTEFDKPDVDVFIVEI